MSQANGRFSLIYRLLLHCYPTPFRGEFAAEMEDVFDQAAADAACAGRAALAWLCVRELVDWPRALGREWASCLQASLHKQRGALMNSSKPSFDPLSPTVASQPPAPWTHAALAAAGLLVPGLALALTELPALHSRWATLVFGSYLLVLIGLLAGWIRGFPRWSYPYLGYGLFMAWYLSTVTTPGFRILGYTFVRHERWGWRAWLGVACVAALALLATRSLRPLGRLFRGIWRDGDRLSLALYGVLPWVIWGGFGEVHNPYSVCFLVVSSLFLAAGAYVHMRSSTAVRRLLALPSGLTASWLLNTVVLTVYWHGWKELRMAAPMVLAWLIMAMALVLPGLAVLVRRSLGRRRAA